MQQRNQRRKIQSELHYQEIHKATTRQRVHNDSQNKISRTQHTPSKTNLVINQKKGLLTNLSSHKQTKVSK